MIVDNKKDYVNGKAVFLTNNPYDNTRMTWPFPLTLGFLSFLIIKD